MIKEDLPFPTPPFTARPPTPPPSVPERHPSILPRFLRTSLPSPMCFLSHQPPLAAVSFSNISTVQPLLHPGPPSPSQECFNSDRRVAVDVIRLKWNTGCWKARPRSGLHSNQLSTTSLHHPYPVPICLLLFLNRPDPPHTFTRSITA